MNHPLLFSFLPLTQAEVDEFVAVLKEAGL